MRNGACRTEVQLRVRDDLSTTGRTRLEEQSSKKDVGEMCEKKGGNGRSLVDCLPTRTTHQEGMPLHGYNHARYYRVNCPAPSILPFTNMYPFNPYP